MAKPKTPEDVTESMRQKRREAQEKRRSMASGDAEPEGISAAEVLKKKKEEEKENKPANGHAKKEDLDNSIATTASEATPSKKKKRKNKKKKKQQESMEKENSESPKPVTNGTPASAEQESDDEVVQNEESTPTGKKKRKRRNKKKKAEETPEMVNGSKERQEESGKENEEVPEETELTANNRKRKASQRAQQQLALVPVEERKDDSDPDDTNYIVESPDEDGNPKRAKIDNGSDEDSAESGNEFGASAIRHRLESLISGGIFYDSSGDESPSEEMDTELEYSDDSGDSNAEDVDEGEDDDGSGDFDFNEDVLFESDGSDQFDLEDLGFGMEEGFSNQEPNSDDEIDQVISSIRPKEPEEIKENDNESKSSKSDGESDAENEVTGPVDDLEELASDDEEELYAEDGDDGEDLDGFIVDEDDIQMLSTDEDDDNDEDEISGEDDDDDIEGDEDEGLDEEENMVPSDVSDQFRAHGRIGCSIEGYDTKVDNGGLLSLDRTSAPKSRSGVFRPFKFTEKKLTETHSVEVAEDALSWMVAPLEARYFYKYIFQRVVLHVSRRDKNYFKGLFSSDGLLHMVENNELNYGENINVASYTADGGRLTHNPEGRVFCRQLKSFVKSGYSIQCINPQSFSDEIWYLCEILQELTNSFAGANTYLTPANSAGFAPHYDAIDAFILQVEGKKYWRVWASEGETALPDEPSGNFTEQDMISKKLVFEGTLEEGDMLYIPRGFYHSASTGNKHSLHVTVSLCDKITFSHLLKSVAEDVWESIRRTRLLARRSLPPHYIEMNGVAPLDYSHDYKTEIMPIVNNLLDDLSEAYKVAIPTALDRMASEFMKLALPPMLTDNERKMSIYGRNENMFGSESDENFTKNTEIRFIRMHGQRILYESEDSPYLAHRMHNSRVMANNKVVKTIPITVKMVEGLKVLFAEYPYWTKIKNLQCGRSVNMKLAQLLYENGLIMTREP